jgi:hypothetical protein
MGTHPFDQQHPVLVLHLHYQPVGVALDVENYPVVGQKAGTGEADLDVLRRLPCVQRTARVRVALSEFLQHEQTVQDDATEVYERAYKQALAQIPKDFKGQITWGEVDRPFLRLAHGTPLGLMRRRDKEKAGKAAMALAKQMTPCCPADNVGVRFLLGDIALLQGDHPAALKGKPNSSMDNPTAWHQAALIAFRERDYVVAYTNLRRGIAANPYVAAGLTGLTMLSEHLHWHASNVHGPGWAVDYLDSAVYIWTPEEINFVDWVCNASPVLMKRAEMMALHQVMTYEHDAEKRTPYAQRSFNFINYIIGHLVIEDGETGQKSVGRTNLAL